MKLCFVCHKLEYTDKHHLYPIEYGGKEDGATVDLCPSCHRHVHRLAEKWYKENNKPNQKFNRDSKSGRQGTIAEYIFNAKRDFKESKRAKADNARNIVQLRLTNDELAVFHDYKKSMGFKSLERVIKHTVLTEWMKRRKIISRS